MTYIKSPLNYIGGKYKILPQILPLFPDNIETFVDLFCGGCNVGININANKIIFNDNLTYLIDLYNNFKSLDNNRILEHIESRISELDLSFTNQEGYLSLREIYNKERNPLDLFVLIAYSFNHQIRYNSSHNFTTPFGKGRSRFNENMKRNLISFLDKIHSTDVEFLSFNFDEMDISGLTVNDFVYCDPPYLITTGSYNDGKRGFTGWSSKEEQSLLRLLSSLNHKQIRFALSNVIEHKGKCNYLLKDWVESESFNVHYIDKDYTNSNYHTANTDSKTIEVVVTNY